jgi:hypothetical protein
MSAESVAIRRDAPAGGPTLFPEQARLIRSVLFVAAGLGAALAGVLLARRWCDALQRPLDSLGLAMLAIVLAGLATGARLLWRLAARDRLPGTARWQVVFDTMVSASVVGLAAAVSLPESPVVPIAVLWLVVLGGEGATWFVTLRRRISHGEETEVAEGPDANLPVNGPLDQHQESISNLIDACCEDDESSETLPTGVSQRLTRAREDGVEMIFGILRCDFASNLRQQNIHIAFCPPLNSRPELTVDQVDGPTARIRATVVESYGAGMEVKLQSASSEPASVQIQFYACESRPRDATA